VISSVYNYWIHKRKKFKAALIRRLQKAPAPDDPSPHVAFRPRTEKTMRQRKQAQARLKNDPQSLLKLKQLRQEFERARTLLEMIKKRERIKHELVLLSQSTFESQLQRTKRRVRNISPLPNIARY